MRTFTAMTGLWLAASLQPVVTMAQEYPVKSIRIIVPYDAGGISDLVMRMVQPKMASSLGQTIVVEK